MRPAAFARVLRDQRKRLEQNAPLAAEANAQMLGSRIREHILRDDLPLDALSAEWVRFKLAGGKHPQHLWYTGSYLANFDVQPRGLGFVVGTNRPARFPAGRWESLPELLEDRFPVWQLSLDESERDQRRNAEEALEAAFELRTANRRTA